MLAKIRTGFDHFLDFLAYLGSGLIAVAFLAESAAIILRFLFDISVLWPVELTEYILVTVTFLGAAWVLKKERHVLIDAALNLFEPRKQAIINAITSLIGAALCFVLFWYGILATWDHFERGTRQTVKIMDLPTAPLLVVLPMGFLLLFIEFLRRSYRNFQQRKVVPEKESLEARKKRLVEES